MKRQSYSDIIMHTREYDSTAMPVQELINNMSEGNDLAGKKAVIKKTGEIIILLNRQQVWGWENGEYTMTDGIRYQADNALGSLPIALNEIEIEG